MLIIMYYKYKIECFKKYHRLSRLLIKLIKNNNNNNNNNNQKVNLIKLVIK